MRRLALSALVLLAACSDEPGDGHGSAPPALVQAVAIELPRAAQVGAPFNLDLWRRPGERFEVTTGGIGTASVRLVRDDDAAVELLALELDNKVVSRTLDLPDDAVGPIRLRFSSERLVRWRGVRRIGSPSKPLPPGDLAGELAGRDVVVVLFDALRARNVGAWGHERPTTATLDRMAAEGVRFARCRSQTSWTLPSVVTLFTGLPQESHGVLRLANTLSSRHATLAEAFAAAGYRSVAYVQNGVAREKAGWSRGFDEFRRYEHPLEELQRLLEDARGELTRPRARPRFLYLHLLPPHGPYLWPEGGRTDFDPDYSGSITGTVADVVSIQKRKLARDHRDVVHIEALYDEYLRFVDARVGELVDAVEAESDRPLLWVFLSDHGEAFMEHGYIGHEYQVYEEMVRVPLILRAPGSALEPGRVVDAPVGLWDLYPTLVELCGLPAPRETATWGRSLVRLLGGQEDGPRPAFLSARYHAGRVQPQTGMVMEGWKLVQVKTPGARRTELYDLARDPLESRDVSEDHPVRTGAMRRWLDEWMDEARAAADAELESESPPDAELEAELRALGYTGDDE